MSTLQRSLELEGRLHEALETTRKVLDVNRTPQLAADVAHEYVDKFHLAEFVTRGALLSAIEALKKLGLNDDRLQHTLGHDPSTPHTTAVTLEMTRTVTCAFQKLVKRDVNSPTSIVTEVTGVLGAIKTVTGIVTVVEEYVWDYTYTWALRVYCGAARDEATVLREGVIAGLLRTRSREPPCPETSVKDPLEVDLTWLMQGGLWAEPQAFCVSREAKTCLTPRRNADIDGALSFLAGLSTWGTALSEELEEMWSNVHGHAYDTAPSEADELFFPVCPFLEHVDGDDEGCMVLTGDDLDALVALCGKGFDEQLAKVETTFPESGLCAREGGRLALWGNFFAQLHADYAAGVTYLEDLLRKQLVDALGKTVTSSDFAEYMEFHCRKLFAATYAPRPFSISVRLPGQDPEGIVTLERTPPYDVDETPKVPQPLQTLTRCVPAEEAPRMHFSLDASTDVHFTGNTYLHVSVSHRFSTEPKGSVQLRCRARQFGGYIVLLGIITGADSFSPKHAFLLRDKDELQVPLSLNEIPSAQEFQDAVSSLSPEQQRFAQAYREMQLNATLFAMCVVQVKPQMEAVLNLPAGSLVQEIELGHDLTDLFAEHHIPSDLLGYKPDSFEDADAVHAAEKVAAVRRNVDNVQAIIEKAKQTALNDTKMQASMAKAQAQGRNVFHDCKEMQDRKFKGKKRKMDLATRQDSPPEPRTQSEPHTHLDPTHPAPLESLDISGLPGKLEAQFSAHESARCLRPTIVTVESHWTKKFQKSIIAAEESERLGAEEQRREQQRAFDLLDALTKAGEIDLVAAEMHVVVAATHCFDKTLMDTVVQNNVNPVEKVEASLLLAASVLHNCPPAALLSSAHKARALQFSPHLCEVE